MFQRTPNFATPMRNRTYTADERDWNAAHMTEIRSTASPVSGADLGKIRPSIFAEPPEAVRAHLTDLYEAGGLGFAFASYADILYDPHANAIAADFIRDQIRARVHDPEVAELLCPTDHPYTAKRPPLETNYYEVYNQPNVRLVDVASAPIVEVTERAVRTTDGEYELDMIITALGFDAFTGAQLARRAVPPPPSPEAISSMLRRSSSSGRRTERVMIHEAIPTTTCVATQRPQHRLTGARRRISFGISGGDVSGQER